MTKVKAFGIGTPWIDLPLAIAFIFKGESLSSYHAAETMHYADRMYDKVRRWQVTVNGTPVRGPYCNDQCTSVPAPR